MRWHEHVAMLSQAPLILPLLVLSVGDIQAQQIARIQGVVRDAVSGRPIRGALVVVLGSTDSSRTDADGAYVLTRVTPSRLRLRAQAIGYVSITTPIYLIHADSTVMVHFKLAPLPIELEPVDVTGRAPARPAAPGARVLTSRDLPQRGDILGVLGTVVPGVRTTGRRHDTRVMARGSMHQMLFVLDGAVITPPLTFYIDVQDVDCVEIRRGQAAATEFRPPGNEHLYSGVILIWTKGSLERRPSVCVAKP